MKPFVKFVVAVVAIALLPSLAIAADNPKADENAVVVAGNARFTVLTPQLIRMEWSEDGVFEDRATLTFVNRKTDVPKFKVTNSRNKVVIRTEKLTMTYIKGAKFSAENLSAEFAMGEKKVVWHYGDIILYRLHIIVTISKEIQILTLYIGTTLHPLLPMCLSINK